MTPKASVRIALVGDYNDTVPAHQAIPRALSLAADMLATNITFTWLPTKDITSSSVLVPFHAFWCVPASPYRSMDGALQAIEFARSQQRPFLGTCGGFQHAIIEYARNVLGWSDADHGETAPLAERAVIVPLACALVETTDRIRLRSNSRIARIYGCSEITEGYRCRYGLNEAFQASLVSGALQIGAEDDAGEIRAIELNDHPFFIATLFQPERKALVGQIPPLAAAFVQAAANT